MAIPGIKTRHDAHKQALDRPLESFGVELTTHCNLSCKMCSEWKRQEPIIDTGKILSLMDEARAMGAVHFHSIGTEPFMREDTADILSYAERIGYKKISVVSNGLLLKDNNILDTLEKLKTLILVISLDGPKDVHDDLRGKGVFEEALHALREMRKRGITCSISSVIMRQTIDHLQDIVDLACDLDIPVISMQPYQRETSGLHRNHDEFEFRPEEEKSVRKKLNLLLDYAEKKKIIIYTANLMKYVPPYLTRDIRFIPPDGCYVPTKELKVFSSGECYPCGMFKMRMGHKSMGNINEKSLKDLWHNEVHRELSLLGLNRKCPSCLAACSDVEGFNGIENKAWPLKLIDRVLASLDPQKMRKE